ncbi:MAG: CrcB family protein [Propionibacteriales bacterium]|nr:CrcB family protein [Propionibacteriales bacterium]
MTGVLLAGAVAVAGGAGSVLRLLVDTWVGQRSSGRFPWGIVAVNVSGSFLIGLAVGLLDDSAARTVVATGFLGGYTTFSTASLDSARLALRGRGGRAVAHAVGTAVVCVAAAWLGLLLT